MAWNKAMEKEDARVEGARTSGLEQGQEDR